MDTENLLVGSMTVNMEDIALRWPERLGHLRRIVSLVEGCVSLPPVRVEIWDSLGGSHGAYIPSSRLIKLWSGNPVMALTLVHELGHSLMEIGPNAWCKAEWMGDGYLSDPEEIWARAFTQWVCVKTGDRTLNKQLNSLREFHWLDGEFDPIMKYMLARR
jgi:hypothetical protein